MCQKLHAVLVAKREISAGGQPSFLPPAQAAPSLARAAAAPVLSWPQLLLATAAAPRHCPPGQGHPPCPHQHLPMPFPTARACCSLSYFVAGSGGAELCLQQEGCKDELFPSETMSAALSWKTFIFFAWCPGSCRRAGAGSFHAPLVAQLSLLCSHLLQCLQPRLRGLPPQSLVNPVSLLAFSTATDHLPRANSSDSKVLEVLFRKDLKAWTAPGREVQADRGDTAVPGPTHQARCCPCRRDRAWAIHQELSLVLCTSTQTSTSCQTAGTPSFRSTSASRAVPIHKRHGDVLGVGTGHAWCWGPRLLPRWVSRALSLCLHGRVPAHTELSSHCSLPRHLLFFPPHCSLTSEHFNLVAFVSVAGF